MAAAPLNPLVRLSAVVLIGVAICGLSGCADSPLARAVRIAATSTSMTLCTAAFVSKIDPLWSYDAEVSRAPGMEWVRWALTYRIDPSTQTVRTRIGPFPWHVAVARENEGCVVENGPIASKRWAGPAASVWPDIDPYPSLGQPGVVLARDRRIRAAIDEAFSPAPNGLARNTQAVVVVHEGQLIGERYANGITPQTPLPGHSLSKSVTDALVGILVREGRVQPTRPIRAWQGSGDARERLTPLDLLSMQSGLPFDEYHGGFDESTRMWFDEPDPYAYATRVPLAHQPRTAWAYSNLGYAVVSRLVRDETAPEGVMAFAYRELFGPLDMRHVVMTLDQTDTPMGANGVLASARDWARFGELYLDNGRVGTRHILSEDWVRRAHVQTLDAGYGRGFWLNTTHALHPLPGRWGMPEVPEDTYFGRGYLGQFVAIVPSEHLVVVRLGVSYRRGGDIATVGHMVAEIIAALHGPALADGSRAEASLSPPS